MRYLGDCQKQMRNVEFCIRPPNDHLNHLKLRTLDSGNSEIVSRLLTTDYPSCIVFWSSRDEIYRPLPGVESGERGEIAICGEAGTVFTGEIGIYRYTRAEEWQMEYSIEASVGQVEISYNTETQNSREYFLRVS